MRAIRALFEIAAALGCMTFIATLFRFVSDVVSSRKTGIKPKLANYINIHSRGDVGCFLVGLAGIVYLISFALFAKPEIGAFLEKLSYEADYEATLSSEYTTFYCIATVQKDDEYFITKLLMPYGHEVEVDDWDGYSPKRNASKLYIGTDDYYECQISLKGPASYNAYSRVEQYAVANYGDFCASKKSDTYHLIDCAHAKRIEKENLVYFTESQEAEILGFYACQDCKPHRED